MADPLAAALAPETLETGIERALARAIESGSPALVLPIDHLGYLLGSEVDTADWCKGPDGKPYNDGQRVVICTQPKGDRAHRCIAAEARARIRRRSHSLDEGDPTGFHSDRYILGLGR